MGTRSIGHFDPDDMDDGIPPSMKPEVPAADEGTALHLPPRPAPVARPRSAPAPEPAKPVKAARSTRVGISLPEPVAEALRNYAEKEGWFLTDLVMAAATDFPIPDRMYRPRRTSPGRERLVLRLSPAEHDQLKSLAADCATSVSGVIAEALQRYLGIP